MRKCRLMMTLLALITTMTAWADNYTVNLTSEFKAVPTIYAGCQNYLTLEVTSDVATSNVVAQVLIGPNNSYYLCIVLLRVYPW